jgi:hypothetical protein
MTVTNGRGRGPARPPRRTLWIAGIAGAAVIVMAAAIGIVLALEGVGVPLRGQPLPGLRTGPAPWGPNTEDLRARLDRLGQPHSPIQQGPPSPIAHHGKSVRIPPRVGVVPKSGSVAPLYTFGAGGNVLEAQQITAPVHLALFFKIWGVRFTRSCLGGYCGKLTVVVNGAPVPGDPRRLLLRSGQKIVVSIQR